MKYTGICRFISAGVLLMLFTLAGCFTSKFSIVSPDKAKVDRALVGNWNSDQLSSDNREAGLVIRNIDDKTYYVDWKQKNESAPVRAIGCLTEIKGATFAQLRALEEDGTTDGEWLIARVELSGNSLKIRQLNEDFMKAKKITSNEQLRQTLEENVNNDAMYAKDEVIAATKIK